MDAGSREIVSNPQLPSVVDEAATVLYAPIDDPGRVEGVAAMTDQTTTATEQSTGTLMSVNEAIARFRGEWVLLKVTEYDEDYWPSRGYMIAHSPDRDAISEAIPLRSQEPTMPDAPRQPYYVFLAYPRVRSGPEHRAAMAQFTSDLLTAFASHGTAGDRTES